MTVTAAEVPVRLALESVAVKVWLPAVSGVTASVATPPLRVMLLVRTARGSELVRLTAPSNDVATLPSASSAWTVSVVGVPATTLAAPVVMTKWVAAPATTVTLAVVAVSVALLEVVVIV